MARCWVASVFIYLLIGCCESESVDPPGHMQPLGAHRPAIEVEVRDTVPDPIELFEKYIKPGTPVVMKGAAKKFKYFKKWGSDLYLKALYGNWYVVVEIGKYEGSVFGTEVQMPFAQFLDNYKKENYYLIQDVAPKNPMRQDIFLLKSMACGGYSDQVDRVLLLFSSGATKSALHWDDVENIHCVFDGTKEWILFDRNDRYRIPKMKGKGAYGAMDCRSVDMYKYPIVQELPWYHAFLQPGDCLFLPNGWPHHVRSEGNQRNMALAVWFGPVHHPNLTDCPNDLSDLPDVVPLGQKIISPRKHAKSLLYNFFNYANVVSLDEFRTQADRQNGSNVKFEEIFSKVDLNNDGSLSVDEVENISDDLLSAKFLQIEPTLYYEMQPDGTIRDEL